MIAKVHFSVGLCVNEYGLLAEQIDASLLIVRGSGLCTVVVIILIGFFMNYVAYKKRKRNGAILGNKHTGSHAKSI